MTPETRIVSDLAEATCQRIARQVRIALQRTVEGRQSGDDSPLKNVWEELCVQVQSEHFTSWSACEETVRAIVEGCVESLPRHELDAIWLQTDAAWDSLRRQTERDRPAQKRPPVCHDEVIDYVVSEYVSTLAMNWSNRRIREYLDRSLRTD